MPTPSEHLHRARQNEKFAFSFDLEKTEFRDWVVVGLFLSALHYVQAVLSDKKMFPPDHRSRNSKISSEADLKAIAADYLALKKHNELARYDLQNYSSDEIKNTIRPLFETIKNHIEVLPAIKNITQSKP